MLYTCESNIGLFLFRKLFGGGKEFIKYVHDKNVLAWMILCDKRKYSLLHTGKLFVKIKMYLLFGSKSFK